MKKGNVSARKVACRAMFALGCFGSIQLVGARVARAESPRKVAGFEALGTLGYGFPSGMESDGRKFDPYGVMVGLELGYTLPFGLRIGADASRGFGRRLEQTSSTGEVVVTDGVSFAFGGSLGYDLLLPSFRLRGAVDMGLALYWFEGADLNLSTVPGGAYYIGPKVALLWQHRNFEFGPQFKYWVTTSHSVVQVGLVGGVRF
jgi:hypothetical protein